MTAPMRGSGISSGASDPSTAAALATKVAKGALVINVADYCAYDGVTDDSAAFQALLNSIPAASGAELGGAVLHFPKGVILLNTPTGGVIASLTGKSNVTFQGSGNASRIRVNGAVADELLRIDGSSSFRMKDMLVQIIGTSKITNAIHLTCPSPGSVHNVRFENVHVSSNGAFRKAYDIACTSGSPTIYSAQAAFAAGDVGGCIMVNLTGGPWFSTIQSAATMTATLAADITTTTQTTVTLAAAISGAPVSGFTIQVGTERMFVSAGGNTTTLTVQRGRGPDLTKTTHTTGATVTTYTATLSSNAPSSITNAAAPARIQPAGAAVVQNGIVIGNDHAGASDLDIAGTALFGCVVDHCAVAGIWVGNGTGGNILDQWAYGLTVYQCGIGVYMNGGALSIHGGEFSTNVIDVKRYVQVSQECVIDGIRTEGPATFYEMTGGATGGPPTRLSSINIATFNDEAGCPIRHENAGSLMLESIHIKGSNTALGTIIIAVNGPSAASPCHLTAINVATTFGGSDPFAGCGATTCIKTIIFSPRHSVLGVVSRNTVIGVSFDERLRLAGGFARGRTAVADANYTMLTTDMTVAFTSIAAARVVTLPVQGLTLPAGQEFTIKDESGSCDGTKTITITPPTGTIDGAASLVLNTAYAKAAIYTNGTNWFTR